MSQEQLLDLDRLTAAVEGFLKQQNEASTRLLKQALTSIGGQENALPPQSAANADADWEFV